MNSIGGLIFLLIMVAQGVAAIVAGIKKRQAEAEKAAKAAGGTMRSSSTPQRAGTESKATATSASPPVPADPRLDVVSRRRRQIEELRRQAKDRVAGKVAVKADSTAKTAPRMRAEPVIAAEPAPQTTAPQPTIQAPPIAAPVAQQASPVRSTLLNWGATTASEAASQPASSEAPLRSPLEHAPRAGSSLRPGLRGALKSRQRLRELVVLKEILDPPLALRRND